MGTNRVESFSDGVIAVAITLLVLNITVPARPGALAWATSWPTVAPVRRLRGLVHHHRDHLDQPPRDDQPAGATSDHPILILNLLLLMSIGVLPFATELMATYLRESSGETVAALVYGGALLVMAVFFAALNRHILLVKAHMLSGPRCPRNSRRQILKRSDPGADPVRGGDGPGVRSPRT